MSKYLSPWLAAALLGALALAAYWAGLAGGFFFDDGPSILNAPGLRMSEFTWEAIGQAWFSGGAGPTGRPVAQLSFGLNHYLSGFNPWAFKLTNLAIHGLCALMAYGVVRELLRGRAEIKSYDERWVALAVAALWLLHPLQLLPVLHVVQRMTSLSALFLLAAFWLHIVARRRDGPLKPGLLLLAWCVAWPLSILSKETGLLLPLFVLGWELLLRRSEVGRLDKFAKIYTGICLVLVAGVAWYLLSSRSQWLWAGYELRPFEAGQRLLSEARVLWFYVGLVVLPRWSALGLYHDDFAISTDWLTPWTTLPAVLGWVVVVVLVWRLRARAPLVAFGLAWFLIGHLLESTVLPLELVHEHRNYLPLLGLLLAATAALLRWTQDRTKPTTLGIIAVVLLLLCAALTAFRAHQYGDDLRRAFGQVQHHPDSARSQYEAGMLVAGLPAAAQPGSLAYKTAHHHLERALAVDAHHKMALFEIVTLDCKANLGVNQPALDELMHRLRVTRFAPGDRNILYYAKEMAVAGQRCLDRSQMTELFRAALANPKVTASVQAILHSWLADYLWLSERDLAGAREALARSLALNPGHPSNRLKWAQLLWISGERQAARELLLKLRADRLTGEERQTLEQLLATGNIEKP
ncbi:MAG: pilus assembly protein PilF [Hylemonella sp.]|nr:pilus assembly protein PilF [Hylemonella sp.]